MKLHIKSFVIIISVIIQTIGYFQKSLGNTPKDYTCFKDNYTIKNNFPYLKETKFPKNSNYKTYSLNYINNSNYNVLTTCSYKNKSSLPLFHKSRIHVQNDSANISHVFYNYQDTYRKILPFFQLGIQNILSKQIFSIGGGNRYIYNDSCAIGYNTFYHFPISFSKNNNHSPYVINISGELWYQNILFMLNSFYKINHSIFFKNKSLQKNTQYSNNGYQIHTQTQLPIFSNFTGKITLERFFYKKNINNNDINKNYNLILGIDYYPIPMIGFNINKMYMHNQSNNTIYTISIDCQLNTPIMQQINNIHNNNKISLIYKKINAIVQPFLPVISTNSTNNIKYNNKNFNYSSYYTEDTLKCCYQEITGRPGEIKIINMHNNNNNNNDCEYDDKSIQWDIQSLKTLKNYGGDIVLLHKSLYAIHMPNKLTNKENKFILLYEIINKKKSTNKYYSSNNKNQLLISIQDFQETNKILKNLSITPNDTFNNSTTVIINNQNLYDSTQSDTIKSMNNHPRIRSSTLNENQCYYNDNDNKKNNDSSIISDISIINDNDSKHCYNKKIIKNSSITTLNDDYDDLPSPPDSLIFTSSIENITEIQNTNKIEKTAKNVIDTYNNSFISPPIPPPLPSSSPIFLLNENEKPPSSFSTTQDTFNDNITSMSITSGIDKQKNTNFAVKSQTKQEDLLNALLSIHKNSNFSLIGTTSHINKLENITTCRKQKNFSSDVEKIFSKLQITQSASSIDESYKTDDSNDENFNIPPHPYVTN